MQLSYLVPRLHPKIEEGTYDQQEEDAGEENPRDQYAFLRYFMGAEPFPLTGAQFVVDIVATLAKGLESS